MPPSPLTVFVDVDDTLVRSFGSKRMPITRVVEHVRALHADGAVLFAWSSGGAEYARRSAEELGLAAVFAGYLPKPDVILDDVPVERWRRCVQVHPSECSGRTGGEYRAMIDAGGTGGEAR